MPKPAGSQMADGVPPVFRPELPHRELTAVCSQKADDVPSGFFLRRPHGLHQELRLRPAVFGSTADGVR